MSNMKIRKVKLFFGVFLCLVLGIASVVAIVYRQFIVDQITVWNYMASDEIISLVDRAGMSSYGKFLYLASQPELESTQLFNQACERTEMVTSILGCYVSGRIYLYDIQDESLDGIIETTAAHETLHAAYLRLNLSEKVKVDKLLEAEYQKLITIDEYKALMDYYSRSEPGQQNNELHSIIGTEIMDIGEELEIYYSKYFSDRSKVVTLNDKYKSVFRELDKKADDLSAEIKSLSDSISNRTNQYNSGTLILNQDIASFNNKANNGQFADIASFNYARNQLIYRISELTNQKSQIESDINRYDGLIKEFNNIATQSEKLSNSVNSALAPAPSV